MKNILFLLLFLTSSLLAKSQVFEVFSSDSTCNCSNDVRLLNIGMLPSQDQILKIDQLKNEINEATTTINSSTKKDTIEIAGNYVITKQGKRNNILRDEIKLKNDKILEIEKSFLSGFNKVTLVNTNLLPNKAKTKNYSVMLNRPVGKDIFKRIYRAGRYGESLYIYSYSTNDNAPIDFSNLNAIFTVKSNDSQDNEFIIFTDQNEKELYAMRFDWWNYYSKMSGKLHLVGYETKKYEKEGSDRFDLEKIKLTTNLFFTLSMDSNSFNQLKKNLHESPKNSYSIRSEKYDLLYQGGTNFIVNSREKIKVWYLKSNNYTENFMRNFASDIYNQDGLNYQKEIDSIPRDYINKDFWLNLIKTDSMMQTQIVSSDIPIPIISSPDRQSWLANTSLLGFAGSHHGRNGRLEFFSIPEMKEYLNEKSFLNPSDLNPNYTNLRYYNNLFKLSPLVSLTKETLQEKFACAIQNIICEYIAQTEQFKINADLRENAEKEKAIFRQNLISKYGQKYTDEAQNGNIIVGMPQELLPIPLRVWSITSKEDFSNGYKIWCKFRLDTSKRLLVVVRDGKVTRVSTW